MPLTEPKFPEKIFVSINNNGLLTASPREDYFILNHIDRIASYQLVEINAIEVETKINRRNLGLESQK